MRFDLCSDSKPWDESFLRPRFNLKREKILVTHFSRIILMEKSWIRISFNPLFHYNKQLILANDMILCWYFSLRNKNSPQDLFYFQIKWEIKQLLFEQTKQCHQQKEKKYHKWPQNQSDIFRFHWLQGKQWQILIL